MCRNPNLLCWHGVGWVGRSEGCGRFLVVVKIHNVPQSLYAFSCKLHVTKVNINMSILRAKLH